MPEKSTADLFVDSLVSSGGETGRLIAAHDWSKTSIGPIATWPQSLRTALGLLLRSPVPIVMLWNEDGVMLYNDGYSVFAGGRHPQLLGSKVREGWPEVADFNDNIMKVGLAGGTLAYRNHVLVLNRTGKPEEVWLDLDYSPVPDESGKPAGVIAIVFEITERIMAERAAEAERARQRDMLQQMPGFAAILEGPQHLYTYVNDAYVAIGGGRPFIGRTVREAFSELEGQGIFELLDGVYRTGEPFVARSLPVRFAGEAEDRYLDFVYAPVRNAGGQVSGIFVGGYDVTESHRSERRRETLIRLSDEIRDLDDPAEIAFTAARVLGKTFQVSRAGYGVIDREHETITIERDWNAPGIKSLAGVLQFRDYGTYIENLKRGETVVFADAETDPRTAATAKALKAISAQSVVNMPVTMRGRFVGLLYLNHETARAWSEAELALIREIADRTHTASERARVAQELRELNANLQKEVIERSAVGGQYWQITPDLLCVLRGDGYLSSFNPSWTRILGYSEDELRAMPYSALVHPDDIERTRREFEILIAGHAIPRFENRYIRKDGTVLWIAWTASPYGEAYYCTGRDITAERQQAEELAEARAARDRIWNNSRDLNIVVDSEGVFMAANPAWQDILGYAPEDILGHHFRDFMVPEDVEPSLHALADAVGDHDLTRYVNRFRHKDGSVRWISWNTSLEGEYVYAYGRDITPERHQADALQQAEEQLRQAQKMEAVGQLTGGIAHDFNNMLAVVMGSLDLLNRRIGPEDPRARRYVEAAAEGARRAANLTQRLLAFSRQQPLRPESLDANKLVAGMSDLLRHSIGADIRLETVLAGGLWRVHVDPNQLESVILNLGVNARDAMAEGGKLTIETQNAHLDTRYVASALGVPAGQYVLIAITDTGSGMSPEVIAKAFDPFFTTKEVGKGTGLGLSQVYGFVKQSGGHVKIYSEVGQGTTIKIYLPRAGTEENETEEAAVSAELLTGDEREIILVVDDEPSVRQFSADALSELGYRVLEADSAAVALNLLRANPDISLLFTDIVMPDTNGRKLAEQAHHIRPDLKVLYTTGYTRNAVVHNGIVDKGVELIGKPFTVDELAARVRAILDAV
ncbi:MAG: PAS domain S-box protein [Asticcacaulis sp.]|uniref:PAS domain S-box protein n=1 Tax=Asticcacaulis sp. TaxID=1872648 RepID=UPI0039E27535